MQIEQRLGNELSELDRLGRKRSLQLPRGIDFTSNDYLGMTTNAHLRSRLAEALKSEDLPLGSGGSRLLRGNHLWHEQAEHEFAEYQESRAALFFNSGYMANMAVLTALPTRHDVILYDSFVHASLREGIHAGYATKKSFEHNSLDSLRDAVSSLKRSGAVYVVVESLYSMDGDEAPLRELAAFCHANDLALIVDEAHATGLFGTDGRGLIDEAGVRDDVFLSIHPCGKALGSSGAFVCSSEVVKSYLINRARTMIFTTALPPIVPLQLMLVLQEIKADPSLRTRVLTNAAFVRSSLEEKLKHWRVLPGRSPIIPCIIGDDNEACLLADTLAERGIDVRPIRPPTVAEGTSRFRLTVNAAHTKEELTLLCDSLIEFESAGLKK